MIYANGSGNGDDNNFMNILRMILVFVIDLGVVLWKTRGEFVFWGKSCKIGDITPRKNSMESFVTWLWSRVDKIINDDDLFRNNDFKDFKFAVIQLLVNVYNSVSKFLSRSKEVNMIITFLTYSRNVLRNMFKKR